jgi:hypothetical protein
MLVASNNKGIEFPKHQLKFAEGKLSASPKEKAKRNEVTCVNY